MTLSLALSLIVECIQSDDFPIQLTLYELISHELFHDFINLLSNNLSQKIGTVYTDKLRN